MSLDNYSFEAAFPQYLPSVQCLPCSEALGQSRLSSKASAFKPQWAAEDPAKHTHLFADAIGLAQKAIQDSEYVGSLEVVDSAQGLSMVILPRWQNDNELETERLLTIAKGALLDAASKSKNIFLMGYCSPQPFTPQAQGFEATLGVMENPKEACWHVFKKGFCRHGVDCCKQHPIYQMPVRVLVESAHFNSCARFTSSFKQEVADLAMAAMATLGDCAYADNVEAVKHNVYQGWTIEVMPKQDIPAHREYLLALAKNALFNASNVSNTLYIMGYAAKPFITKAQGFVAILGDMQDDTRACWDFYSKGTCARECACRWEHPECLMPINVVVKQRSSLKGLNAALECLAADGLSTAVKK